MTADILIKANLVTPTGIEQDAYFSASDGRITHVGPLSSHELGNRSVIDHTGHYLLPGLIDLQVNGGGGMLFNDAATIMDLHIIINAHKAYGTTGLLATLMTDAPEQLEKQLAFIAQAIATDDLCRRHLLGIHLEGPFFNPERRGTHPLDLLMLPDTQWMQRWITASQNQLKIVTLAPELPGALDVVALLKANNIHASLGHSEAHYDDVSAAVAAGATLGTHVFNTMSQLQGRAPDMVGALLDHDALTIGMINDGHHVHDASLRIALRAKTLARAFFVSDSMHVLGLAADSVINYRGEKMHAKNGAVINERGKFAGSATPLLTALQRTVSHLNLSLSEAVQLCCMNPAQVLGLTERGQLKVGGRADFILLDTELRPIQNP